MKGMALKDESQQQSHPASGQMGFQVKPAGAGRTAPRLTQLVLNP
jgi:hypothetical protein